MKKNFIFFSLLVACFMIMSCEKDSTFTETHLKKSDNKVATDIDLAKGKNKVAICHYTGSLSNPWVIIYVSENAVPAHLAHGDALPIYWYPDDDNDGFGNSSDSILACTAPEGYVDNSMDCDDSADIFIGIHPISGDSLYFSSGSWCFDCTVYFDSDWDGYGDPARCEYLGCEIVDENGECEDTCMSAFDCWPSDYLFEFIGRFVLNGLDCNDFNPSIGPGDCELPECDGSRPLDDGNSQNMIDCEDYGGGGALK